ncbi:MAG: acyl-ACP--UDP-N-acetylglucosamine O-acyltransferase [Alphaproteobacteria bacterium]|nr:acyl-ACP--UDP-N-acetylglucosamine O-acyltransferase [Alphaproteobacteria bacterium]
MTKIHPSSVIDSKAEIADDVEIGPFCTVGPNVVLKSGVKLISHAVIDGRTEVGARTVVYPFAALGMLSQHKMSHSDEARLVIGEDNIFREHTTAHVGSPVDKMITTIGNRNLFLVGSHVAHDCILGDDIVMSNCAALAGHVQVGNFAIISGLAGVHQFTRIGEHAMIGAMAAVIRDVIPYGLATGNHAHLDGLNLIGLKRRGFNQKDVLEALKVYKLIFKKKEGTFLERIDEAKDLYGENPLVKNIITFLKEDTKRQFCMAEGNEEV